MEDKPFGTNHCFVEWSELEHNGQYHTVYLYSRVKRFLFQYYAHYHSIHKNVRFLGHNHWY